MPDRDLQSIQQARDLLERARRAQRHYAEFSQSQIDGVIDAMAGAALAAAEELGRLAVEETGMGRPLDKKLKNEFSARNVYNFIRPLRTVGVIRDDRSRRVTEIAEPVGVVAAIIPTTNPTSTAIYKILIALKAGNGVVISPHPRAEKCIRRTVEIMERAALAAGVPEGLIGCMQAPTLEGTQELMSHKLTGVVLATGGSAMVRAAYSSGKPAFGVGPGNVPAYIERSATVDQAVLNILVGTTFDYGTICSSEQAIVCDRVIAPQVRQALERLRGYWVNRDEAERLAQAMVLPGPLINPAFVGQSPQKIAEMAGLDVPPDASVLLVPLEGVGRDYPLSMEKLSPVLAYYEVEDWREACERCHSLLKYGGMGHTLGIHSNDEEVVLQFALKKPAFRITVNTPTTLGAIGFTTALDPSMTLGCGAVGGNITSDNISPLHLMNVKRLAWEIRPHGLSLGSHASGGVQVQAGSQVSAPAPPAPQRPPAPRAEAAGAARSEVPSLDPESLRSLVREYLRARGLAAEGGVRLPAPLPPPAAPPATKPAAAPAERKVALDLICEEDVRRAQGEGYKLVVGPRTRVTALARDLGERAGVFLAE
ncbi:MAG TPA: aldehyde dehydrogenase family protein [Acidobacteriota bacterium]